MCARHHQHLPQPWLPLPGLQVRPSRFHAGAPRSDGSALVPIPRHEYPGRLVLAVGLFLSSWCVVGLILLLLG